MPFVHKNAATESLSLDSNCTRDRVWVDQIAHGDLVAFEAMFDAYAASLAAYGSEISHSQELAEEVVQDVFLAIWTSRERWTVRHSLRIYLFQAVRNRVISRLRHDRPEQRLRLVGTACDVALREHHAHERADDALEDHEIRLLLSRVLAALPARNREVFLLVRQQHLTYAEAADILGITVKTVEAHMTRAFHALRLAIAHWRG